MVVTALTPFVRGRPRRRGGPAGRPDGHGGQTLLHSQVVHDLTDAVDRPGDLRGPRLDGRVLHVPVEIDGALIGVDVDLGQRAYLLGGQLALHRRRDLGVVDVLAGRL